jgi:transposase
MGTSIRNFAAVTRIGLDLARKVFQVHAVDAKGEVVAVRKLTRSPLVAFFSELPPWVVAMEACSSAHHWGRQLLALGSEVRISKSRHAETN